MDDGLRHVSREQLETQKGTQNGMKWLNNTKARQIGGKIGVKDET